MRMRRGNIEKPNGNMSDDFIQDVQGDINEKGIKNAVCILLGEDDNISIVQADGDDPVQSAGIVDLGKSILHDEMLEDED